MKTKIELGYRVLTIENKPKDDRFELTVGSLINNKKKESIYLYAENLKSFRDSLSKIISDNVFGLGEVAEPEAQ